MKKTTLTAKKIIFTVNKKFREIKYQKIKLDFSEKREKGLGDKMKMLFLSKVFFAQHCIVPIILTGKKVQQQNR